MTIKPSKIIRQCCIITQREIKDVNAELHIINKIGYLIEDANELARKLNYSKDSGRYSLLDLDYYFVDRPISSPNIKSLNQLLSLMRSTSYNGIYTYIIDGEFDKNGKRLLDNSVKIKKIV